MKKLFKRIFPVLLTLLIIVSTGWYLLEYDPAFTRDILLQQARRLEDNGNLSAAVWMYNLAYDHFGGNDEVAIELAQKFKEIGNYSKAEYTLRKAIEDGGNEALYMALSRTYVEQGKIRDAVLMLENVSGEMKEKLEALRPSAPQASLPSGSYREYLTVVLTAPGHTIYVASDHDYPSSLTDAYTSPIQLTAGETTLFAVSVAENGLVSSLAVYNYIIYDVVEAVTFADAGFEAALRKQLGYSPDRVIYSNDLWTVMELALDATVGSCADLRWVPFLQQLTVNGAVLDDGDALAGCTNLLQLTVAGSDLSADVLEAIGSLRKLTQLSMTECSISSIASLAGLQSLTSLDLSSNAIRDISSLAGLTALRQLDLSSNALVSLEGLEGLSALQRLDVSFNSITSTAPLSALVQLQELDVSSNALRTLENIGSLAQLKKLYASYNDLLDLDVLADCIALTHLDVSHNTLLDVDIVADLTTLEELNFSYNEVTLLPDFGSDHALRIIDGSYNKIASLKRLSKLQALTHVYMDYNEQISNITALTACKALVEVHVYGTKVRHVSALTNKGVLVVYSPV